jgi:hypothetical protein
MIVGVLGIYPMIEQLATKGWEVINVRVTPGAANNFGVPKGVDPGSPDNSPLEVATRTVAAAINASPEGELDVQVQVMALPHGPTNLTWQDPLDLLFPSK